MKRTSVSISRQEWHDNPPDWVVVLAEQCDLSSQHQVADDLSYSQTVINQVLRNRYEGSMEKIKAAVRGAYLDAKVNCPVLGEIGLHDCMRHQRAKFQTTNSARVRLYRACRGIRMPRCKHSKIGGGS